MSCPFSIVRLIISHLTLAQQYNDPHVSFCLSVAKHHDGLVEAGLFKRLIGLLELKDDKLQETCLKVLSSFESKYMKELIEANYVDAIVKLLDPTNAASIAVSALVYGTALDFCEQADLRKLLIEAGIIRILTDRVLGVADQAVVGSEMRAVVLYLLSELPLTFKMMQETQLLVALHNTITQVFRVDLFLYAGAWSAIWRRKDPNLVPNISIISLSLDLINQILEMRTSRNDKFPPLRSTFISRT